MNAVAAGLLGDTPQRDYAKKLQLFNAFAAPELRRAVAALELRPGMRVLDVGCGTGETLRGLHAAVAPDGFAMGIDLSQAHIALARQQLPPEIELVCGDILTTTPAGPEFDAIWSVNTINHFRDPRAGVQRLAGMLLSGGTLTVGQSGFLSEMFFAWDSRLERAIDAAVRRYYLDRYGLQERVLSGVRAVVGLMRGAGLVHVHSRTLMIERMAPVDEATEAY